MIEFEVSGLEESSGNALKHYEIKFSEAVNADWLIAVIKTAIDSLILCSRCGNLINKNTRHWCINKVTDN
jgi:recombinational DNA repair protein RecR